MTTDLIADYVDQRDFTGLFVEELGWNRPKGRSRQVAVPVEGRTVVVEEVATLKGVTVWSCSEVPDGRAQREIDRHIRRESDERLTIFHDVTSQQWKWPQARDTAGAGSVRLVTHEHTSGRKNPALAQRLHMVSVGLDEDPTVVEINRRLRRAFDADAVTRKFYRLFSEHHNQICDNIEGIEDTTSDPAQSELRWYGSLLMNRLMFIYFMQRKGLLDDDPDYLRNRLQQLQAMERPGSFYEFYKDFLLPLFHSGLGAADSAAQIDDPKIAALIGDVPYVNGGIFAEHIIEKTFEITVSDEVFISIFNFFDSWQWHLDDRPSGNPEEINPDVLGYIFEQFINQKQQGAYYTKEDVTGYMTANTLIPVFLERLERATGINPWRLLASQPDRYIWDGLRHGEDEPLPDSIQHEATTWPRPTWDSTKPGHAHALPGETWWETVDRRRHAYDLRMDLAAGRVRSASDLVIANVDLETLAVDAIDALDNPDDVVATWRILTALRIIDPTCGSGAFLFAALNILHGLYAAVLDAARAHVKTKPISGLTALLQTADDHQSTDYYLLKHAALNNIYGVDLMPEAVEIARLRLFLKLIAQVDDRRHIEPLPDLEFNIRPGNILVGALNEDEIRDRTDLTNLERVDALVDRAAEASATYRSFAEAQERGDDVTARQSREQLGLVTQGVRDVLNQWWHEGSVAASSLIESYIDVHRPFHWFIEFPEVFESGGFDVVVGNPPYINRREISYAYSGFQTNDTPDIYAPCTERALSILGDGGRLSLITPHSLMQSSNFRALRRLLASATDQVAVSAFARIPSGLFENDVRVRNTILLAAKGNGVDEVQTSRCRRWYQSERPHLMQQIRYVRTPADSDHWPFVDSEELRDLWDRLAKRISGNLAHGTASVDPTDGKRTLYFKTNAYNYLSVALEPVPVVESDGSAGHTSAQKEIPFASEVERDFAYLVLAGRLGLLWWAMHGDDFNVTKGVLLSFPISLQAAEPALQQAVLSHKDEIVAAQRAATTWKQNKGKRIGNWNLAKCRPSTDLVDESLMQAVDATLDERAALWTSYHRVYMGGEE